MGLTVATKCLSEQMTALEDFSYQLVTISLRLIAEVLGLGHTGGGSVMTFEEIVDQAMALLQRYSGIDAHDDPRTIRAKVTGHVLMSETQALLNSLIDSLPTAHLLLLVNYRPEYAHGWGRKTYYTQLRLHPLSPTSAEELLQALLGDDPGMPPLKRLLIERTEGNPFFLEESVRTLIRIGALVGEGQAYRLSKPIQSFQMPATVQVVLAARIDRLTSEEKHLLQTAAVIGTDVPSSLLRSMAEMPEDAFHTSLSRLQAAEFLYETHLLPEHLYTFKHALTHEVAYGNLLQERRRVLHARIVDALETNESARLTDQVEQLAHHACRGEAWDKAVRYCRQAGQQAAARSVHREAVARYEQALAALTHLPEQRETIEQAIDLRCDLRNSLVPLSEYAQVGDSLRQAETLAEGLQDRRRLGRLSAYMAHYLWATVHHTRANVVDQSNRPICVTGRTLEGHDAR